MSEQKKKILLPRAKKMDSNLFEIRIKVARNQYRAFYCYAIGNLIYILNGFVKKTQKTPLREIQLERLEAFVAQAEASDASLARRNARFTVCLQREQRKARQRIQINPDSAEARDFNFAFKPCYS